MDWIIKAANEQNAEMHRQETIKRGAPTLWTNLCRMVERAVAEYRRLDVALPVEFSGCADHTIWVATFDEDPAGRKLESERDRVTVTFNEGSHVIEARLGNAGVKMYPIDLDNNGHVCLMEGDKIISPEDFTERVLRKLFFPG